MENNYTSNIVPNSPENMQEENKKFSIETAILFGWHSTLKHFWLLIGVIAFDLLIIYVPNIISKILEKVDLSLSNVIFYFVFSLVFWIISVIVSIGFLHITVLLASNLNATFSDLFSKAYRAINYIVSSILYAIIVAIGLILLIIPGIIFMIRFQFYQYAVLEENIGPIQALKASWHITKGQEVNLILFWLSIILVNVLGALALGIGLFITIPLTMVATAYVYKKLAY